MSHVERVRADTKLPQHLNDFLSEEGAFQAVNDPPARPMVVPVAIGHDVTPALATATGDEFLSEGPVKEIDAALALPAVQPPRLSGPPRHIPAASIAVSACALLALLLVPDVPGWIRSTPDRPPTPGTPESEPAAIALPQAAPFAPLPAGVAAQPLRPIESVPSEPATSRPSAPAAEAPRLPAETTRLPSRELIVEPPPGTQALPVEPRATINVVPPITARPLDVPTAVRPAIPEAAPPEMARPEATGPEAASSSDANLIGGLLNRYRGAFSALDAAAARSVWPNVDHRALERAFAQLDEQAIAFDACQIDVDGVPSRGEMPWQRTIRP